MNGLGLFDKMSKILNGEDESDLTDFRKFPDDYLSNNIIYFKYALITSVDAERTFSAYKIILSNRRDFFSLKIKKNHFQINLFLIKLLNFSYVILKKK